MNWRVLAHACRVEAIPRSRAIFDVEKAKIAWDEDLFAEPGSSEEFTTRQVEQFLKLQREALAAQVAEAQRKKKRVRLAEFDAHRKLVLPKGWHEVWSGNIDNPKAFEHVFMTVAADGKIARHLVLDAPGEKAAQKEADRKAREKQKAAAATAASAGSGAAAGAPGDATTAGAAATDDAGEIPRAFDRGVGGENAPEDAPDAEPVEAADRGPLTKAGLAMVAAAKTEALRLALIDGLRGDPVEALALTILAFTASNVDIRGVRRTEHHDHPRDLAAKLLLPGGDLPERLDAVTVCQLAGDLLGRFLTVGGPDAARYTYTASSGDAAEWIGRALDADRLLPRFDTEAFLAQVTGAELKKLAGELGMRTSMKVEALRSALIGNAGAWRPAAAQFGAAAPVVRAGDEDEGGGDSEMEDAA